MNSLSKIALFTLLSGAVFAARPPTRMPAWRCTSSPPPRRRKASAAKASSKLLIWITKITIAHEAIPAVNWPPMTMRFTITPQTQLNNVKDGDNVDFTFVQQGNLSLLQDIRAQ